MTDVVMVALIGAVPATLAAAAAFVKLRQVESRLDGRLDELLTITRTSSFAKGVKQETDKVNKDVGT